MKVSELPISIQEDLTNERQRLAGTTRHNNELFVAYSKNGRHYLFARRTYFRGGASHWLVKYGKTAIKARPDLNGNIEYHIGFGTAFKKTFNGIEIPVALHYKKEIVCLATSIGIFNI